MAKFNEYYAILYNFEQMANVKEQQQQQKSRSMDLAVKNYITITPKECPNALRYFNVNPDMLSCALSVIQNFNCVQHVKVDSAALEAFLQMENGKLS